MKKSKIWLSSPHMGGNELKYIHEAFDTNWVAPLGPNVIGFENDIEKYLNESLLNNKWNKYTFDKEAKLVSCTALTSGTAAIHLGLIILGVEPGDEVICQSMTFAGSSNPISYLGAQPIFVDSEPETWNICPNALEECIIDRINKGKKPKAIIAVHLYGMPYKVDEINEVAERYEIPILEDAAEAFGSSYKDEKCGTFGDISILSFNGNKIITTSGGGALISKNKKYTNKALFLATQAKDNTPHYQHSEIGYNYRLSNISAGIGRGQMQILNLHVQKRRQMNDFYKSILHKIPFVSLLTEPNSDYFSNYWLTSIIIEPNEKELTREKLRLAFEKENIESRPLWKPMHLQPVHKNCEYYGGNIAENLFKNGLCLPSGSNLNEEEKHRIKEVLVKFFS